MQCMHCISDYQAEQILIRSCILTRTQYLARVVRRDEWDEVAHRLDEAFEAQLRRCLQPGVREHVPVEAVTRPLR